MTNSERLLRAIFGPIRSDLRPLIFAVDVAGALLFTQHFSMDDILVTKLVYPAVAKMLGSKPNAATRRVERLARLCWDVLVEQDLVVYYLGRSLKQAPPPGTLIMYLAVYAHFNMPFFTVIELYPRFLFQSPRNPSLSSLTEGKVV